MMDAKKIMVALLIVLLVAPMAQLSLAATGLTVEVNPKFYNSGDIVEIKGSATVDATINISLKATGLDAIMLAPVTADSNGAYSVTYELPSGAATGIWTVKASSETSEATCVFFVTTVKTETMAEDMIEIAEGSATLASEVIEDLMELNTVLPASVEANMKAGDDALIRAQALLDEGKNVAVIEAAQRAMVHYKNALSIALRAGKVEEAIEDKEKALENWIERLTREAERLIDVVDRLDEESEDDFEIIRAKIASAEAALDDASDLCENEEYDEALIKVKEARDTLKEVMDLIKPILKEVRKGMLEQFKLHLRERIEALEVDVGKMKNFLSGTKMSEALSRFGRAKGLINQAENRLRNSQDDEALDDLDEASQELDDGIDEFDDGYVQGLRGTNQIRAQVQILEQMAEQYQRKGKDASEILGKIEELEGVLDEGLALLFKGQAFGANGILDRLRRNGWFDGMNFRNGPTN